MRCGFLFLTLLSATLRAQNSASPEFFETKIRPVFANNCYSCHTSTAMGGLRLDSPDGLGKGSGKHGPLITPGDPEKSALILAVRHTETNFKMPMGAKLKDSEIADLTAWVKAGAVWPKTAPVAAAGKSEDGKYVIRPAMRNFWSFQPLKELQAPAPKDPKWAKSTIDKFVLARLEKEGLKPVKAASKRDLIRRASLDLTGIPPTYEEIAAFEKDATPDAFAKVVDRLLASPHYGERWGRFWLDVARYGEDDYRSLDPMRRGYNPYPNAHVYRDWVIKAFQDDLPYDQFVKAQIAGDLLDPKIRHKTLPATGFLGLGPWYYDNGSTEVTRADERHDRVDVVTRGFLGLTVACARCHDHKYDPIPASDYYAIAGVFKNTIYEEYPLVPKSVRADFQKIEDQIDQKQKLIGEIQNNQTSQLSQALAFQTANYLQGAWEVTGTQKKEMAAVVEARKLDYELLDRWIKYLEKPTTKYKNKEAWQAMIKKGGTPAEAKRLAEKFQDEVLTVMLNRNELTDENKIIAAKALDGTKPKKRTNKPSNFVTNEDFCPGCNLTLKSLAEADANFATEIFQRMLSDADDPNAMMEGPNRFGKPGVLMFRGWGLESRIGSEAQAQIAAIRKDIEESRKKLEPGFPYLHGVKDAELPTNLELSFRGDPFNLGPQVPRHFLSVLSKDTATPFSRGSGRLELAEAILQQPIAMRVIVNRIWKGHFGTGLVDSPSNFGMTGERPTNPELLEYLASTFAKNGQSIKKLHREIMLTSVYQLSTENDPVALAKDSGNRLYWRADRKRMDAEQVRDSILQVAGDLDPAIGGPSAELTPVFKRRTVYGKVSRYKLDEYLQLFDFPSPNLSAEKRFVTTVPQQRLFLMNSDFMQLEAEELAKRVASEPNNRARIRKAHQLVHGRDPSEAEVALGLEYLKAEPMLEYEEGKKKPPAGTEPGRRRGPGAGGPPPADISAVSGKPEKPAAESAEPAAPEAAPGAEPEAGALPDFGMGMMGGMGGRRPAAAPPVKYEPTAWGRYAKVLLSSSEFLFIN
ncbi:MAG: PSD1 and planctomycete cytochrome C domain-containing protein [Bryobacteraceae bacterium]|nr:PSD1 and planctomycete cytochrome C domain-containing protein [Bryobacteraceae bacterium]